MDKKIEDMNKAELLDELKYLADIILTDQEMTEHLSSYIAEVAKAFENKVWASSEN